MLHLKFGGLEFLIHAFSFVSKTLVIVMNNIPNILAFNFQSVDLWSSSYHNSRGFSLNWISLVSYLYCWVYCLLCAIAKYIHIRTYAYARYNKMHGMLHSTHPISFILYVLISWSSRSFIYFLLIFSSLYSFFFWNNQMKRVV